MAAVRHRKWKAHIKENVLYVQFIPHFCPFHAYQKAAVPAFTPEIS